MDVQIEFGRPALDAAQHQMLDGVVADVAEPDGLVDGGLDRMAGKALLEPEHLDIFPLAGLAPAGFQKATQGGEYLRQRPSR